MKKFPMAMIITSFALSTLCYAQNSGYSQNREYTNDPYYQSQPGYSSQPQYPQGQMQYQQNPQGQMQYQDGNMNRGYGSNTQRYSNQNGQMKSADQSTWSSWIGKDDKTPVVPDESITSTVMQNLRNTPYLSGSAKNLQVLTKDGKVTLKGTVANKNEKNLVEYIVKSVEGVKSVSNDVEVQK